MIYISINSRQFFASIDDRLYLATIATETHRKKWRSAFGFSINEKIFINDCDCMIYNFCYTNVLRVRYFREGWLISKGQTQNLIMQILHRAGGLPIRWVLHFRPRGPRTFNAPAGTSSEKMQELPHQRVLPVRGTLQLQAWEERETQEEEKLVQVSSDSQFLPRHHPGHNGRLWVRSAQKDQIVDLYWIFRSILLVINLNFYLNAIPYFIAVLPFK